MNDTEKEVGSSWLKEQPIGKIDERLQADINRHWGIDLAEVGNWLQQCLKPSRLEHSLGVQQTAVAMAVRFEVSLEKAALAGLMHDCAKSLNNAELLQLAQQNGIRPNWLEHEQPQLLHATVGAKLIKKRYPSVDQEILAAVASHTFGREAMSKLDKIIFLADMIEPGRDYPEVTELRQLAFEDLDGCLLRAFDATIIYLVQSGRTLHPQTVTARNYLLQFPG